MTQQELEQKVTELLGIPYVKEDLEDPADDPTKGFSCWGWARYYWWMARGIWLPRDIYVAQHDFVIIEKPPYKWLDVVCVKNPFMPIETGVHIGVLENPDTVTHMGINSIDGMSRESVIDFPWNTRWAKYYRYATDC